MSNQHPCDKASNKACLCAFPPVVLITYEDYWIWDGYTHFWYNSTVQQWLQVIKVWIEVMNLTQRYIALEKVNTEQEFSYDTSIQNQLENNPFSCFLNAIENNWIPVRIHSTPHDVSHFYSDHMFYMSCTFKHRTVCTLGTDVAMVMADV